MTTLAPIIIFAYNRPHFFAAVVDGLRSNELASESTLYVFCDGAKSVADGENVAKVRSLAKSIEGFRQVTVIERSENFGLARSIIEGVSDICERHGSAIILEDDVLPNRHFLSYVNAALNKYADDPRVASVGCYTFDAGVDLPDSFFLRVPDCCGWAVWKRSWATFETDGKSLMRKILARGSAHEFDSDGSYSYTHMLKEQTRGRNQSWAVRWYAHIFLTGGLVLYPRWAVTQNIGLADSGGTHGAALGSYLMPRLADLPITVRDIAVEESVHAREARVSAIREIQPSRIRRLMYSVRSSIGLRSSFRRIRRSLSARASEKAR